MLQYQTNTPQKGQGKSMSPQHLFDELLWVFGISDLSVKYLPYYRKLTLVLINVLEINAT